MNPPNNNHNPMDLAMVFGILNPSQSESNNINQRYPQPVQDIDSGSTGNYTNTQLNYTTGQFYGGEQELVIENTANAQRQKISGATSQQMSNQPYFLSEFDNNPSPFLPPPTGIMAPYQQRLYNLDTPREFLQLTPNMTLAAPPTANQPFSHYPQWLHNTSICNNIPISSLNAPINNDDDTALSLNNSIYPQNVLGFPESLESSAQQNKIIKRAPGGTSAISIESLSQTKQESIADQYSNMAPKVTNSLFQTPINFDRNLESMIQTATQNILAEQHRQSIIPGSSIDNAFTSTFSNPQNNYYLFPKQFMPSFDNDTPITYTSNTGTLNQQPHNNNNNNNLME
ncbi:hypothetical protein H4219_005249, partial [Mycoemilia scoparia]